MKLNKPLRSFTWKNWLWITVQTIFLFFLFLLYNNGDFILKGEEDLLTRIDKLKKKLVNDPKPPYDFVFVNVGKDL
ncbi:MAG TPA: hypothetical protein VHL77_02265, partial [Ferruginibacter sp.]|nr:hypothetical protein [Ferruginibacter sp.]